MLATSLTGSVRIHTTLYLWLQCAGLSISAPRKVAVKSPLVVMAGKRSLGQTCEGSNRYVLLTRRVTRTRHEMLSCGCSFGDDMRHYMYMPILNFVSTSTTASLLAARLLGRLRPSCRCNVCLPAQGWSVQVLSLVDAERLVQAFKAHVRVQGAHGDAKWAQGAGSTQEKGTQGPRSCISAQGRQEPCVTS